MKKLLIITGPQGSGNHLFSRIFSMHEYWLDEQVWHGIQPKSARGLDK